MSINTRHALHPLALAVTLALAACGGNQDTPQTSAPGPQTKADAGLPATTLDTADTPAAAQTSASGRATKAVATADTPPLSENRKMLRGDVLIQALLSRTARLDAQNNPQTAWLSPETYTWGSLGAGQQGSEPSVVPVVLASQDIRPTDANTAALGRHYYQFEISQGPRRLINDPLMLNIASQTLRFGLSAAGLPNGGTGAAQAAAGALEIGTQAQAERPPSSAVPAQYAPPLPPPPPPAPGTPPPPPPGRLWSPRRSRRFNPTKSTTWTSGSMNGKAPIRPPPPRHRSSRNPATAPTSSPPAPSSSRNTPNSRPCVMSGKCRLAGRLVSPSST